MHKIMGHEIGVMVSGEITGPIKGSWHYSKKHFTGQCSCGWKGKEYDTLNMADKEALWHALEVISEKLQPHVTPPMCYRG